jgi:hypothetical protein
MADANLWSVIVGGLIGIGGGLVGPPIVHWLQAKERAKQVRAEKFEALVVAILESRTWLVAYRNSKFYGKEEEPTTLLPIAKAYSIATIYFPHLLFKLTELNSAMQDHVAGKVTERPRKHVHDQGLPLPRGPKGSFYRAMPESG